MWHDWLAGGRKRAFIPNCCIENCTKEVNFDKKRKVALFLTSVTHNMKEKKKATVIMRCAIFAVLKIIFGELWEQLCETELVRMLRLRETQRFIWMACWVPQEWSPYPSLITVGCCHRAFSLFTLSEAALWFVFKLYHRYSFALLLRD